MDYMDYMDKIFWDLPRIIRTKTGNTVRYNVNAVSNAGAAWLDHEIVDTGAYLEVDNVVEKESIMSLGYYILKHLPK